MTSSNKILADSRINSYLAAFLSLMAIGTMAFLFVQVRSLDAEFSDIRRERPQLEAEVASLQDRRDTLNEQIGVLEARRDSRVELKSEVGRLQKEVDEIKATRTRLQDQADAASKTRQDATDEVINLRTERESLKMEIEQFETRSATLERRVSGLIRNRDQLNAAVAKETQTRDLLTDEVGDLSETQNLLIGDIQAKRRKVAGLEQQRENVQVLSGREAVLGKTIEVRETKATQLETWVASLQAEVEHRQLDRDNLVTQIAGLRAQQEALQQGIAPLEKRHEAIALRISESEIREQELSDSTASAKVALDQVRSEIKKLQGTRQVLLSGIATAKSDMSTLRDDLAQAEVGVVGCARPCLRAPSKAPGAYVQK